MAAIRPLLPFENRVECHCSERSRHQLVGEVGIAAAKIVGQIADDGLFLGKPLDLFAERLADTHLLAMAERVGFAVLLQA